MLLTVPQPPVDRRTATDFAAEVRDLLPQYLRGWQSGKIGPAEALVRIFARYCEMIVHRLNQAPEKNFLSFLDFLGASPLAPQPARVPLTFYLAQKAAGAMVPVRTQVAAPPPAGEQDAVIFETERELEVTAANLDSLFIKDPVRDTYTDGNRILFHELSPSGQSSAEPLPILAFRGEKPIPHILYLGLRLPSPCPILKQMRLRFEIDAQTALSSAERSVVWEAIEGILPGPAPGALASSVTEDERFTVTPITATSDGTSGLTKRGEVVLRDFAPMPEVEVNGVRSRWLRCRFLATPASETALPAALPKAGVCHLKSVGVHIEIERAGLRIDAAFTNAVPIDLTKEFVPFGGRPKLGDTLYLASREAFSLTNSLVTIHFELLNPASEAARRTIPAAHPRAAKLVWEYWDGATWAQLGTSESERVVRIHNEATNFSDTTAAFSESGDVSFKFPSAPLPVAVNGQTSYWVRVRIAGGDYGEEAHWEQDLAKGYVVIPATLAPPILTAAVVDYVMASDSAPEAVLSYEDFRYTPPPEGLKLLQPLEGIGPALYLGFAAPRVQSLSLGTLSVYFGLAHSYASGAATLALPTAQPTVVWEYWSCLLNKWTQFAVRDDTNGLRGSGAIPFLTPPDFCKRNEFGRERFWLRAQRVANVNDFEPALKSVLLNTVMAVQAVTSSEEVLGSSNGKPDQAFRTIRTPVLEGQVLDVLEPTLPSDQSAELIRSEEGEDAVSKSKHPFTPREEIWVRWHLVPNFYASGPMHRHYVLDRLTGEVKFGDGEHGRIPPSLAGNIRMKRYRSGGGARGNQAAGLITQLLTTLPYVERAANLAAASGGADAESRSALLDRAPRGIRHGHRAVTAEDYEDMAVLASPAVARVRCVPLYDLDADPDAERQAPGVVSLIVVPRSTDPKPLPSLELCDRVRKFLNDNRVLTADLVIVAPEYVAIRVEAELAVTDPSQASDVQQAAMNEIRRFLHPLTGRSGSGWEFGQVPANSDLYALLEGVRGVSHVRRLRISRIPGRPGAETTSHFLIYSSDRHQVTVTFEE